MEVMCINHEQQVKVFHHLAQCITQFQTGDRYGDSNHGGKSRTADTGNVS